MKRFAARRKTDCSQQILRLPVFTQLKGKNRTGGSMKLKLFKREAASKCESKKLRREGKIPAVLYNRGSAGDTIAVEVGEFSAHLRKIVPGRLSTTIFTLAGEDHKSFRAIVKDIQYDPVSYNVIHLDFETLIDDKEINLNVPIELIKTADCKGVKQGGVLRQVIRRLLVRCLPKDIPSVIQLDVENLEQRQSRRLKDLDIPNTVRPLVDLNEVVAIIAKR